MEFEQAKQDFLNLWGTLGSQWGINRSMAQVHALLMVSPVSLCTEDIMEQLQISRGNANMTLRDLLSWNLIYKDLKMGERKEFFRAEKDIWEVAKRVTQERRRREIEPLKESLRDLQQIDHVAQSAEALEFVKVVKDINKLVNKLDNAAEKVIKADENWFFGRILNVLK